MAPEYTTPSLVRSNHETQKGGLERRWPGWFHVNPARSSMLAHPLSRFCLSKTWDAVDSLRTTALEKGRAES